MAGVTLFTVYSLSLEMEREYHAFNIYAVRDSHHLNLWNKVDEAVTIPYFLVEFMVSVCDVDYLAEGF